MSVPKMSVPKAPNVPKLSVPKINAPKVKKPACDSCGCTKLRKMFICNGCGGGCGGCSGCCNVKSCECQSPQSCPQHLQANQTESLSNRFIFKYFLLQAILIYYLSRLNAGSQAPDLSTRAQLGTETSVPPSFYSESINLPSGFATTNRDHESLKEIVTFGDEPDLTSHRWSPSSHSHGTSAEIIVEPMMTKDATLPFQKNEIIENLKEDEDEEDFIKDEGCTSAMGPSDNSLIGASEIEDEEIIEIMGLKSGTLKSEQYSAGLPSMEVPESKITNTSSRRMSWLRGEIDALKSFPSIPDRFKQSFRKLKNIGRKNRTDKAPPPEPPILPSPTPPPKPPVVESSEECDRGESDSDDINNECQAVYCKLNY